MLEQTQGQYLRDLSDNLSGLADYVLGNNNDQELAVMEDIEESALVNCPKGSDLLVQILQNSSQIPRRTLDELGNRQTADFNAPV